MYPARSGSSPWTTARLRARVLRQRAVSSTTAQKTRPLDDGRARHRNSIPLPAPEYGRGRGPNSIPHPIPHSAPDHGRGTGRHLIPTPPSTMVAGTPAPREGTG
ncbi:unnamed protein product, partial [Ectocarpus fasciculatus]